MPFSFRFLARLHFAVLISICAVLQADAAPFRIQVQLDAGLSNAPVNGRLIVFMKPGKSEDGKIDAGFIPGSTWITAREVRNWQPGENVEINGDDLSFPTPFSKAPAGPYSFLAVLDPNHTYVQDGQDAGDLVSSVTFLEQLDPATAPGLSLTLTKKETGRPTPTSSEFEVVTMPSKALSKFFGREILVEAAVVVPTDFGKNPAERLPAVYRVHGFGGNHLRGTAGAAKQLREAMAKGERFRAVQVFLNASCPTGHHVFADSANNGPWGEALTKEFIPFLEKKYRLLAQARGRFLTGHSSGGWSTLWLQVAYPDFFGGTWPTAPDSVDFRSFTGVEAVPGATTTAYTKRDGSTNMLVRMGGKDIVSFQQFSQYENVLGEYGGQIASFDWVFSPRGADGRPVPLFDRGTGVQNPQVQEYWQRYDISRTISTDWARLGPKLAGKVHLTIGLEDTFHLEEASKMLCAFLASKGREDACTLVPGRDHMNLYNPHPEFYSKGLAARISDEMQKSFAASAKPGAGRKPVGRPKTGGPGAATAGKATAVKP